MIDFTDVMVKDVVVAGLVDEEVKKDVLGWSDLDDKSLEETITFIEAKEMARDALNKGQITAGISTYKKGKSDAKAVTKAQCKSCKVEIEKLIWSRRQKKMVECALCLPCWKKNNPKRGKGSADTSSHDETSALLIGGITTVTPIPADMLETSGIGSCSTLDSGKEIVLDHHIFDSHDGWKKTESMPHPTLRLQVSTDASDYDHINATCPTITPSYVNVVTDTGAQSALMSLRDFHRVGFKDSDLLPVKRTMRAANMEEIEILGAVFIRLSGTDSSGNRHTAPIMVVFLKTTYTFTINFQVFGRWSFSFRTICI